MLKKLMMLMALVGSVSLSAEVVDLSNIAPSFNPKAKSKAEKLARAVEHYYDSQNPQKKSFKHILLNLGVSENRLESKGLLRDCAAFLMEKLSTKRVEVQSDKFDFLTERVLRLGLENKFDFDYVIKNEVLTYLYRHRYVRLRKEPIADGLALVNLVRLPSVFYDRQVSKYPAEYIEERFQAVVRSANDLLAKNELFYANHIVPHEVADDANDSQITYTLFSGCGESVRSQISIHWSVDNAFPFMAASKLVEQIRELNKNCFAHEQYLNSLGKSDQRKAVEGWLDRVKQRWPFWKK